MKLVEGKLVVNKPGTVKIIPEELDDLWLAYNLIAPGDIITAETTRKIHHSTDSEKNGKNASRVRVTLDIRITAVDYQKDSSVLRLKGKTMTADEHVSSGVFHTLEIEKNKQFDLKKNNWSSDAIEALRAGCDRTAGADLVVLLLQEGTMAAQFYSVGKSATAQCAKIEAVAATKNKSSQSKFFENVFVAFTKHVDFSIVRSVLIGSSGSMKDEFRRYLLSESMKTKMKSIQQNKSRIFVVNTKGKNSLKEVLNDVDVVNMIKDTKASIEIRAFIELSDTLRTDADRACYGPKNVEVAQEMMAIETLLITDDLLKSAEIATRKKYIELVKSVKKAGGKAYLFSSTHVNAEQLVQLTGVAAILRFPLPDIDEIEL